MCDSREGWGNLPFRLIRQGKGPWTPVLMVVGWGIVFLNPGVYSCLSPLSSGGCSLFSQLHQGGLAQDWRAKGGEVVWHWWSLLREDWAGAWRI